MPYPHTPGRPAQFDLDDVVEAAVAVGLPDLSVQAVAARLGVSATAVYRLVPGRVALERLAGEAVLSRLELADDPSMSTIEHLVDFAMRLRHFTLDNPGIAAYAQHSFPRGRSGVRAMSTEVSALIARGYTPGAAVGLCSIIASLALGLLAAEDARLARSVNHGETAQEAANASAAVLDDPLLRTAHFQVPALDADEYFHLVMTASARGLVASVPTGQPLDGFVEANRLAMADRAQPCKETESLWDAVITAPC